ncbi:hypothetical protein D3C85_1619570 [compost metagenome]
MLGLLSTSNTGPPLINANWLAKARALVLVPLPVLAAVSSRMRWSSSSTVEVRLVSLGVAIVRLLEVEPSIQLAPWPLKTLKGVLKRIFRSSIKLCSLM